MSLLTLWYSIPDLTSLVPCSLRRRTISSHLSSYYVVSYKGVFKHAFNLMIDTSGSEILFWRHYNWFLLTSSFLS